MPTLLSINNYYYRRGGAEVVFLEQNRLFSDAGWRVVPFASKHPSNVPNEWSEFFVDEIEFESEYSLREKLERVPKVIYSFEARRKLKALLRKISPTVAHAHNVYHHISPSIFSLLQDRNIPTVLTLHDLKIACPAYKMLSGDQLCERCKGGNIANVVIHRCIKSSLALSSLIAVEAIVQKALGSYARHVNRFVVPSRFYLEKLVEWGWPREKFTYVANFVEPHNYQVANSVGEGFIYAGRLGPEKGLKTFIKAAALAKQSITIVGTGPEEASLKALAASEHADTTFLGYLSGDALHAAIRQARALVLPSEWYENGPVSVLEAYALGRPVLGAAIGGIPEFIRNEMTGLTFASGNVEALAATMTRMSAMPEAKVAAMGSAGRAWVEEEFTPQHYRRRLLDIYADLCTPTRRATFA